MAEEQEEDKEFCACLGLAVLPWPLTSIWTGKFHAAKHLQLSREGRRATSRLSRAKEAQPACSLRHPRQHDIISVGILPAVTQANRICLGSEKILLINCIINLNKMKENQFSIYISPAVFCKL